jgi:hypothetical protein
VAQRHHRCDGHAGVEPETATSSTSPIDAVITTTPQRRLCARRQVSTATRTRSTRPTTPGRRCKWPPRDRRATKRDTPAAATRGSELRCGIVPAAQWPVATPPDAHSHVVWQFARRTHDQQVLFSARALKLINGVSDCHSPRRLHRRSRVNNLPDSGVTIASENGRLCQRLTQHRPDVSAMDDTGAARRDPCPMPSRIL